MLGGPGVTTLESGLKENQKNSVYVAFYYLAGGAK